ncbi:MAG: aminoglycoside phosphotransferase family protein [Spirochaetales bacterium]|nr:aminoglycoside phosphotransferase family protein [Spirochaetales bacterium]
MKHVRPNVEKKSAIRIFSEHIGFAPEETTFLERRKFEHYYSMMMINLEDIVFERTLVHGSFSTYNVLTENGKVSAVIDWQDARFGDPLFDLASMDYWPTGFNIPDLYERFCSERGIKYHDYNRRIIGCKYYQTLGNMLYFARIDHYESYKTVVDIADNLE